MSLGKTGMHEWPAGDGMPRIGSEATELSRSSRSTALDSSTISPFHSAKRLR